MIRSRTAALIAALRKGFGALVLSGCAIVSAPAAHAQSTSGAYPAKPVRIIVAYAPGGAADIVARLLGKALGHELGQPFVIENQAGAGGTIGTRNCARAAPDGYTLCMGSPSSMVVAPMVMPDAQYNASAFVPISLVTSLPNMLVVSPKLGVRTVDEWMRWVRANPGASWGTSGVGTTNHLTAIYLNQQYGTKIEHVPYKGGVLAVQDVLAGHIPMAMDQLSTTVPHVRAGTLVPIAVSGSARLAAFPNVPTLAETLLPKYRNDAYQGVFAPARVPSPIIERLSSAIRKVVATDESLRTQLIDLGGVPVGSTSEEFKAAFDDSAALLRTLVTSSGIVGK